MTTRRDFYPWRIVATAASFILFGIGGVVLGYLVFPLVSVFSPSKSVEQRRCRKMVQVGFRAFIGFMKSLGVLTWEMEGEEKLQRGGQLIIANHPTLIDIVFLISRIDNATCIVKLDLFHNFFTRGPVSRAGYVPNDTPDTLIDNCVQALEEGATLVIFPEGTRSVSGKPLHFRRGAAYVQLKSRCKVVLGVISCTPPTLSKHEKWYQIPDRRFHVKLAFEDDPATNAPAMAGAGALQASGEPGRDARSLTRQWLEYFEKEVVSNE